MSSDKSASEPDSENLPALKKPVKDLENLCARYLPIVSARIWETCCWPDRMTDGWKIGDYKFIVVAVSPDPKTELYIQFWSEPREQVLAEVCSGEWSPRSLVHVQAPQRRLLRSLGYEKGGQANNFGKMIDVRNAREAEDVAREALRILFEAFGFCGQWPLRIQCERGERAEQRPVFSSITPEDLAKLLAEQGCTVIVPDVEDTALVLVKRGRRRFTARLDGRVPRQDVYRAVILDTMLEVKGRLADAQVASMNNEIAGLIVRQQEGGELRLSMLMLLEGGVTQDWILQSVGYWLVAVRNCERLLRSLQHSPAKPSSRRSAVVH